MQNLWKTYDDITGILQKGFAASDVIWETLCKRLLLIKYLELKITDKQNDDFLRMLSKNDLPFS